MRPAIASTPKDGDVQSVPKIQIAALLCILFSALRGYDSGILL